MMKKSCSTNDLKYYSHLHIIFFSKKQLLKNIFSFKILSMNTKNLKFKIDNQMFTQTLSYFTLSSIYSVCTTVRGATLCLNIYLHSKHDYENEFYWKITNIKKEYICICKLMFKK